jgi:serine/threonine protein kinase
MPAAQEGPLLNRRLGDFEIVREVGRGGMGVVYEARQASLNRKVALKVLSAGVGLSPKAVQRFHREAEAAAKLHHTNIVPIYATGEENGTHFYAMELIEGPSLDLVIRDLRRPPAAAPASPAIPDEVNRHLTPLVSTGPYVESPSPSPPGSGLSASSLNSGGGYFDAVARMIAEVADALAYAHQQGVIHRDIKPSNLLLSPAGRLSVNDFGLARLLEQPALTLTGEFVGTPAYMSPEQIAAGRVPVDHRTDVYALGATLYELLTLRPPFTGASRDQLLAQIIQKEPPRPRQLNPKVPVDLETICLKCLEKDPDRRYPTAGELADDLRRYVNRFAILAKRPGPLTRLKKWVKRNRALSAAAAVMLLAAGAVGYSAWYAHESHQRFLAESKKRAEEGRELKQRAAIDRARVAAMATDLLTADAAITEAEALGTSAGDLHLLRGFVAQYSGDPSAAIKEFRAAVVSMPESVAAHALLSAAYAQVGDYEASDRVLTQAERLPLQGPEDRLFLGLALSPYNSPDAVPMMRAAQRERPSKIGEVLLADALCVHASDMGTVHDARAALEAAETAMRLLPDNPHVVTIAINARVAAAAAYDLANEPQQAGAQLDAASGLAESFSGSPDNYALFGARLLLATYRDGLTPPLRRTERLRFPATIQGPEIGGDEVMTYWRLGEIDKARARLDTLELTYFTAPLKVGLALEEPGGRAAAQAAWRSSVKPDDGVLMPTYMTPWLYLTGEPERVREKARELRASGKRWGRAKGAAADFELLLQFWEGNLEEADYLKSPPSERPYKPWRNVNIGMKRLGEGDREGAKAAFTEAYQARYVMHDEWLWATTFLVRMNTDKEWPRAIPKKKP